MINAGPSRGFMGSSGMSNPYYGLGQRTVLPFSGQDILPTTGSPFRTYGTVQNGRVVPPADRTARPSNIPTGGGAGTWEGGGPGPTSGVYTGPTNPSPYQQGGGFTGVGGGDTIETNYGNQGQGQGQSGFYTPNGNQRRVSGGFMRNKPTY
jgi:hypothetical protein